VHPTAGSSIEAQRTDHLGGLSRGPDGGGRVLLTGPGDNQADVKAMRALGLDAWVDPYVRIGPPDDVGGAWDLLDGLAAREPGWLLVTSPRAYPAWAGIVGHERLRCALVAAVSRGLRAAGVGVGTIRSLPEMRWPPPIVASAPSGASLAQDLVSFGPSRALLPQSEIATGGLVGGLAARGWDVLARAVYTTTPVVDRPESAAAVEAGAVGVIVLRSPSAVDGLLAHARPGEGVILVAGGATTAAAAHRRGLPVRVSTGPRPEQVAAMVRACLVDAGKSR
jgi:uroporphyrinogen-III synthase